MASIYFRARHKSDVYSVTSTASNSGQQTHSWAIETTDAPCDFEVEVSNVRMGPTVESILKAKLIFRGSTPLSEGKRIYNIRDRYGSIIEAGPYEIIGIQKLLGFQGKTHHVMCQLSKVIE